MRKRESTKRQIPTSREAEKSSIKEVFGRWTQGHWSLDPSLELAVWNLVLSRIAAHK